MLERTDASEGKDCGTVETKAPGGEMSSSHSDMRPSRQADDDR